MLRNVSLEDISDGRLYTENDLVRVILTRVRAVRLYVVRIWEVQLCLTHMTVTSSQPG